MYTLSCLAHHSFCPRCAAAASSTESMSDRVSSAQESISSTHQPEHDAPTAISRNELSSPVAPKRLPAISRTSTYPSLPRSNDALVMEEPPVPIEQMRNTSRELPAAQLPSSMDSGFDRLKLRDRVADVLSGCGLLVVCFIFSNQRTLPVQRARGLNEAVTPKVECPGNVIPLLPHCIPLNKNEPSSDMCHLWSVL